jgi:hypothetical protein
VDEVRRQGELADVPEEEPGAELVQGVPRGQSPTERQPQDGPVDRVLDEVEGRSGAVAGQRVGVLARQHLVEDAAGHFGELVEDLVGKQRAGHDGRLLEGSGERGACVVARPE